MALAGSAALAVALLGGGEEGSGPESDPAPLASPAAEATTGSREPAAGSGEDLALSARRLAGQRLVAGYDGSSPPAGLRRMIRRGELAGVILFEENISTRRSTRRTIHGLQRMPRPDGLEMPLIVAVDQEGGLVERLPGPPSASAAEMGSHGRGFARRQGERTGRRLSRAGINVDLAPVLDVARPGSAIAGERRSFAHRPSRVIEVGVRGFARGLHDGGVVPAAKHFPGLGAAETNTDAAAQRIELSRRRLRATDEAPFAAFVAAGGQLVMLSLAAYPELSDRPAALSRAIATGELRRHLGYEGVSISDSLDAEAARGFGGRRRVALAAAGAGTDLLLYGDWRTARAAARALRQGLSSGRLDREESERSVARIHALRRGLAG